MIHRVSRIIAPPVFQGDQEKTRAAGFLNTILWTIFVGAILAVPLVVIAPAETKFTRLIATIAVILLSLVLIKFMHGGHVHVASNVAVLGVWAITNLAILFGGGGVRSIGFPSNIIVVLMAGILRGRRAALSTAGLCIATGLAFLLARQYGMIPYLPIKESDREVLILYSILLVVAAVLLNLSLRNTEHALSQAHHEQKKYRNIFDNAIDGIFQSTPDGRFVSANPAMARMYGYGSPEEMIHSITDIASQLYVEPELRADLRRRLAAGEQITGFESLDYRKDHSTFWISMNVQAIRDENGNLLFYEGTVEDITPRKKVEAERERLIEELAAKNTELEQFTYTVSHDLKAPIITIKGFLGFLEKDVLEGNQERIHQDVLRVNEAVSKMHRLLTELLELSRIGRMMNALQTIRFEDLIHDALDNVHGRIEARGVAVQTQPNLPAVYGDRQRLTEVLQNLFDNAAKFMGDQAHPRIEIGQQGEQDGNPVFFVRDNGMGIAPLHHERVFGLFNKLNPKMEGTGVGLALVKRIIEFHGGRIWIESEVGKGTTFYFTLAGNGVATK